MRFSSVAMLGAALCLTGCGTPYPSLTRQLWTGGVFRNFNEPAPNTPVEVFASLQPPDFMVTYDEASGSNDAIRRRAFYSLADLGRINSRRKPRFVSLTATNGLASVTVVTNGVTSPLGGTNTAAWVEISRDGRRMVLVEASGDRTDFQLPTYERRGGTVARLVLTPPRRWRETQRCSWSWSAF